MKKRWYIVLIILLILGFIYTKVSSNSSSVTNGKKQTSYKVKRQILKQSLSLSGTVNAEEHVILRFQSSGMLAWVGVKEGDYVKKYQGIASLDQRDIKNKLQKYLNSYVQSRLTFDSSTQNNDVKYIGGLTTDQQNDARRSLQKAQMDLNSSVLDVELQTLSLQYANLSSPIDGLIVRVESPYTGVNITPSQAEFEIINPKTIYFSATADQNDVVNLKQDQTGEVILDAFPHTILNGKIYMISFIPKTGETGTVYQVKILLNEDNADYHYRFGMTGDANFTVREIKNALYIPTKYVKTEQKPDGTLIRNYVLKKVNNEQVKTTIKIAEEVDDNTIITSGLQEDDTVYD